MGGNTQQYVKEGLMDLNEEFQDLILSLHTKIQNGNEIKTEELVNLQNIISNLVDNEEWDDSDCYWDDSGC